MKVESTNYIAKTYGISSGRVIRLLKEAGVRPARVVLTGAQKRMVWPLKAAEEALDAWAETLLVKPEEPTPITPEPDRPDLAAFIKATNEANRAADMIDAAVEASLPADPGAPVAVEIAASESITNANVFIVLQHTMQRLDDMFDLLDKMQRDQRDASDEILEQLVGRKRPAANEKLTAAELSALDR